MKKSLLALAVLGAFAGVASAQTSVTIYGLIDASVQYIDTGRAVGGSTDNWLVSSGQMSGSRIGFRGTEDLGGGLSAIFTLETGFAHDDGTFSQGRAATATVGTTTGTAVVGVPSTDRLFGRQAWVGLQGGFGQVRLGRQQTAVYAASVAVDPFAASASHGTQRFFGSGIYNTDPFLRADNTISYTTSNFNGLTASVGYSFGERADAFNNNRTQQAGASYVNGPLNVQLAYQKSDITPTAGGASEDIRTVLLGGSYDLGVVKPFAAYVDTRFEDTTAGGVTTSEKVRNYLLGLSAPVGAAGTVLASWIRNDNKDVNNGEEDQYSIGYVHNLSKRTNLYTAFTLNDAEAAGGVIAANGQETKRLSVGMRHSF